MKKIITRLGFYLFFFLLIISCSKSNGGSVTPPNNPTNPIVAITPKLTTLPNGWKLSTNITMNFPSGIELYYYDSIYAGRKTKMFCLAYDSKDINIEFKPLLSSTAKTPSSFYKDESGIVYAAFNGGFFGVNQSYSLVKYNNTVSSANIKVLNRTYNGVSTAYYPTRAAFGMLVNGNYEAAWIYHIGTGNDMIYSYPLPSFNVEGKAPLNVPDQLYPNGGVVWNTTSAIGGSPVLIKNGTTNITDTAEMISINNTTSRPRTAIGVNGSGIVMIFAVEGDNTLSGYDGMNLVELANVLKSFSCKDAINLDGGGSTSLVIGGQLLVRPGDNGVERPVVSAVLIKKK
jgi:hypothetical protein